MNAAEAREELAALVSSDWFLQHLVSISNDAGLQIGLTVQVGGLLVSGQLVSGEQYFEGIAADFEHGLAAYPQLAQAMKKSFASFGVIYKSESQPEGSQSVEARAPNYIHLTDARFFSTAGDPIPQNKGVWWRGRISAIGGFTIGQLRAD
jgi:hypothetical protein